MRTIAKPLLALLSILMLGVTVVSPGTVTTVVNPKLFTPPNGDEHLHGIVRDPVSGFLYVGDWNLLTIGNTPFFGPYMENRDSIRRINALAEVSAVGYVISPRAMAFNAADRQVYVVVGGAACGADPRAPRPSLSGILAIDPVSGKLRTLSGGSAGSANGAQAQARFAGAAGIAVALDSGVFYVSEGCLNRIREVDSEGDAATFAGTGERGSADGPGTSATFNDPRGIAYCASRRTIYVADAGNNEIRTIDLDGKVSTLAGSTQAGFANGRGAAARFNRPTGVACDDAGNVYVADSQNNAIRTISADGVVTTLAGNGLDRSVDGIGAAAQFSTPGDLTYDAAEQALYVIDWGSNSVRKVIVSPPTP